MDNSQKTKYEEGPEVSNSEEVIDWLKAKHSENKCFLIPVIIVFKDEYKLEIESVFIGAKGSKENEHSIFLSIDDSRTGIPFSTRALDLCKSSELSCFFWIEGYWTNKNNENNTNEWEFILKRVLPENEQQNSEEAIKVFKEL